MVNRLVGFESDKKELVQTSSFFVEMIMKRIVSKSGERQVQGDDGACPFLGLYGKGSIM